MNRVHEFFTKGIVTTSDIFLKKDTSTVLAGLGAATNETQTFLMEAFNKYVVWIVAGIIAIVLFFLVATCVGKHKANEQWRDKLIPIAVTVVILVLELSFPSWGWKMVGWAA